MSASSSCELTDWQTEVTHFITDNYSIQLHDVKTPQVSILYNGHSSFTSFSIPYESIRHSFARKKNMRPPTRQMRLAFDQLKALKAGGQLCTFKNMPLKYHEQPVYSDELLSAFYFWSLSLNNAYFPMITVDSTHDVVQQRVHIFLQFCTGRYTVNKALFSSNNLLVFKSRYLLYVDKVKPTNENLFMTMNINNNIEQQ